MKIVCKVWKIDKHKKCSVFGAETCLFFIGAVLGVKKWTSRIKQQDIHWESSQWQAPHTDTVTGRENGVKTWLYHIAREWEGGTERIKSCIERDWGWRWLGWVYINYQSYYTLPGSFPPMVAQYYTLPGCLVPSPPQWLHIITPCLFPSPQMVTQYYTLPGSFPPPNGCTILHPSRFLPPMFAQYYTLPGPFPPNGCTVLHPAWLLAPTSCRMSHLT